MGRSQLLSIKFTFRYNYSSMLRIYLKLCIHLAMYVVFESSLQMLSDKPSAYRGQVGTEFLKSVPATWDETISLDGDIEDFVVVNDRTHLDVQMAEGGGFVMEVVINA